MTRRMIFPDRVLGMSGTIQTFFGRAILPISVSIAGGHLVCHLVARLVSRLERDVHLDHPAADVVDHRNRGGLGDLGHGQRGGLELLGAQPVPGHVDDVVDPAQDPDVAVRRLEGAVTAQYGQSCQSLLSGLDVVLAEVHVDEALGLAPDRSA